MRIRNPDFPVFTRKTSLMQRLADAVNGGHGRYVSGQIAPERLDALIAKFLARYHVNLPRWQAARIRKEGEATGRLFAYHCEAERLHWFLLMSDGRLPPNSDPWQNVLDKRSRMRCTTYELVRLTKPHASKPVLTWRYTREQECFLRTRIIHTVRSRQDSELRSLLEAIRRSPGFAGVRAQVKRMHALLAAEWVRARHSAEAMPPTSRIGYVRRIRDVTRPLRVVIRDWERRSNH